MAIPSVVRQILSIGGDHWERMARWLDDRARRSGQRTIVIGSALRGEGCTTIALALALLLAEQVRRRVLLVDFSAQAPELARRLSLGPVPGLESVLLQDLPVEEVVRSVRRPPLDLLPLNSTDSLHLSRHPRLPGVLAALARSYDHVVVDAGSLLGGRAPAEHLPPALDAALIVRHPSMTSDCLVQHVRAALADRAIQCLGIIENAV